MHIWLYMFIYKFIYVYIYNNSIRKQSLSHILKSARCQHCDIYELHFLKEENPFCQVKYFLPCSAHRSKSSLLSSRTSRLCAQWWDVRAGSSLQFSLFSSECPAPCWILTNKSSGVVCKIKTFENMVFFLCLVFNVSEPGLIFYFLLSQTKGLVSPFPQAGPSSSPLSLM